METSKVIKTIINKKIVSAKKGRGRKGYGSLLIVRLLVYSILIGIFSNKGLWKHLQNHRDTAKILGFKTIPNRSTISRWKKKHFKIMQQTIDKLGFLIQSITSNTLLIFDSAPIVDEQDKDAKVGCYSKGFFKGFKIHLSINQLKMPLKAIFTHGNKHDSPLLPELVNGLKALFG